MNCERCKGACCEIIFLPLQSIHLPSYAQDWFELHGKVTETAGNKKIQLDCRCTKLNDAGRCSIYDSRPSVCRIFPVGGQGCLAAVKAQRSALDYQFIRDSEDPETI